LERLRSREHPRVLPGRKKVTLVGWRKGKEVVLNSQGDSKIKKKKVAWV
jgi:hypothetical protein